MTTRLLDPTLWDGTTRGYIPPEVVPANPSVRLHTGTDVEVDPVTFEVVRGALININFEHADLVQRLSLSPIVMMARDFQASLLGESGEVVCLGAGVQYFSNQNSLIIKYMLEHRTEEGEIGPGDLFLCNDPYVGSAHQQDTTVAAPVFIDGEIFCWVANSMHFQDLGGSVPGSQCVSAADVWQEPMLCTPIRLVQNRVLCRDVENLFVRQSRFPTMTRMDLRAGVGAAGASRDKIEVLVKRYGGDVVKSVMRRMVDAGEQLFVDRLRGIPDGRWSHRGYVQGSMPGDRTIHPLWVTITKEGDRLVVDNEGTTSQQPGGCNLTYAAFSGMVLAALTQQMVPELAGAHGGVYRRVDFRFTSGLMNCAEYPAAVSATGSTMCAVGCSIAGAVVSKMLACGDDFARSLPLGPCAPNLNSLVGGGLDANGQPFLLIDANGLMGSLAGRPSRDGVDMGGQWWIPDSIAYNCEDMESQSPIVVLSRRQLPVGADGGGRHRAGVGFASTLMFRGILGAQMINYQNEGFAAGQGVFGGNPGGVARCRVKRATDVQDQVAAGRVPTTLDLVGGDEEVLSHKGNPFGVTDGDVVEWLAAAAPGYGDPLARDPELVLADVAARMMDADAAERVYGVVVRQGVVDAEATSRTRAQARRRRLDGNEPHDPVPAPAGSRPVGEHLHVVDGRWWCNGADLGPATENYKARAVVRNTPVRQTAPEFATEDVDMADRVVLREYLCPVTGLRIDAELIASGDEPVHDILIAVS